MLGHMAETWMLLYSPTRQSTVAQLVDPCSKFNTLNKSTAAHMGKLQPSRGKSYGQGEVFKA